MLRIIKPFGLRLFLASALALFGACSNPLSTTKAPNISRYQSTNASCSNINFSSKELSPELFRSLLHCLNSRKEFDAAEKLGDELSDSSLEAFTTPFNSILRTQPDWLSAVRELYAVALKNGQADSLSNWASHTLSKPSLNQALAESLRDSAGSASEWIVNSGKDTDFQNLASILESKSFARLNLEVIQDPRFPAIIQDLANYLLKPNTLSLEKIFQAIGTSSFSKRWKSTLKKDHALKLGQLANFMEWIFKAERFSKLSDGIRHLKSDRITCFSGGKAIPSPFSSLLENLKQKTSSDAKAFFKVEAKNLYLLSRGYCSYTHSFENLLNLGADAASQEGFELAYQIFMPLFEDEDFTSRFADSSLADLIKEVSWLLDKHFTQDLLVIASQMELKSVFTSGQETTKLLNSVLLHSHPGERAMRLGELFQVATRGVTIEPGLIRGSVELVGRLPSIQIAVDPGTKASLQKSLQSIFESKELPSLLTLIHQLVETKRLFPLIDELFQYFHAVFFHSSGNLADVRPLLGPSNSLASWLIEKPSMGTPNQRSTCDQINLDWNFNQFEVSTQADYLRQLTLIERCLNPNQTFRSLSELAKYSIAHGQMKATLRMQDSLINNAIELDQPLLFQTAGHFLKQSKSEIDTAFSRIRLISVASSVFKSGQNHLDHLREWIADWAMKPESYGFIASWLEPVTATTRTDIPTVSPESLKLIDGIITRDLRLKQEPRLLVLQKMFKTYCPSLSAGDPSCQIESDQVARFRENPDALFVDIAREYTNSVNSWMHPNYSQNWDHEFVTPTRSNQFEYHFRPVLNSLKGEVSLPRSALAAVSRMKQDQISIAEFLSSRARRLTLIPYRFEIPTSPASASRFYGNKIRLRLVSDLDRLELIAINADFNPYGYTTNFGMGMIRDIGLAWGDETPSSRPSSLKKRLGSQSPQTLREVKGSIESMLDLMDNRFVGMVNIGNEIKDIHARIFNLRFMISLLEDELPVAQGGRGGLILMRDLFYSLDEGNTEEQRGRYGNALLTPSTCLKRSDLDNGSKLICKGDHLNLVPSITRLGLLHQASLAAIRSKSNALPAIDRLLNQWVKRDDLMSELVSFVSSQSGARAMELMPLFSSRLPKNSIGHVKAILDFSSLSLSDAPIRILLSLLRMDPDYLVREQAWINSLLHTDSFPLQNRMKQWQKKPETPEFLFSVRLLNSITPAVRDDLVSALLSIRSDRDRLATLLSGEDHSLNQEITQDMKLWLDRLSTKRASTSRNTIANWIKGQDFEDFCDVFSDSGWIDQVSDALSTLHQNPDSLDVLRELQNFLEGK
jgi:hypothetical protein